MNQKWGESNAAERSQFQFSLFQIIGLKFIAVRQFPFQLFTLVRELFTLVQLTPIVGFPVFLRFSKQCAERAPFAFVLQSQQ